MIIISKFNSICPICNESINHGEKVEWSKGSKASHEQCHKSQQAELKQQRQIEHDSKQFRYEDKIELIEDIYFNGIFGNRNELVAPKGTKGKITSWTVDKKHINGKYQEVVLIEEMYVRNGKPKSKRGVFVAPLNAITILKKGKCY